MGTVGDMDQPADNMTDRWYVGRGENPCPTELVEAQGQVLAQYGLTRLYVLSVDYVGDVCVWAVVRDAHGAAAFFAVPGKVSENPPVARIEVLKPMPVAANLYALYSPIQISGAKSQAADGKGALTYEWTLTLPGADPQKP